MIRMLGMSGRKFRCKLLIYFGICFLLLILFHILEMLFYLVSFYSNKECCVHKQIDVVYTWVNGSDPIFLKELNNFLKTNNIPADEKFLNQRFDDKHELKFSLRSLEKYAPWINHVYIVTNGQIPYWLNLDYEKVTIVTHKEIFLNQNDLPTFSSPAIESHIHRIPGLSKKFLYFNDDIFLGQPIFLNDFICPNNGYIIYLSYSLGMCAPQCFWAYVADDQCDESCNNYNCQYDGGDCDKFKLSEDKNPENSENPPIILARKIKTLNETGYNEIIKTGKNYNRFEIPKELENKRNYSVLVNEYNSHLIENNKIKRKRFKRKQRKLRVMKTLRNNRTNMNSFNRTRCAYGDSLQYSNRLFNLKYGFMPRFVPAHTPVLIDKDIMDSFQKKFFKEVMITSKNKFRSNNDLQYSFSYYYFIMHERKEFNAEGIFDEFDTDLSGTWSDREIRTLMTRIYELPLSYAIVDHFESILLNCSEGKNYKSPKSSDFERYIDSRLPTISKELVLDCPELIYLLRLNFGQHKKYKHQISKNSGSQYMYFKQLQSNITDVVGQLDEIRSEPRKFICLNDNLDYSEPSTNEFISSVMYDFYVSFFPFPSKFELPKEYRNKFLNMDDLNDWRRLHFNIKLFVYIVALFIIYLVGFNICVKKICVVINKVFY